jgi:hypothetical protein
MKKIRKKLLSNLKAISTHFKLNFSKQEIIGKTAFALDSSEKKLLIMHDHEPYFKTIDLGNVSSCTVKVDYKSINAGDLRKKTMDDFIEKIELQIAHIDPAKSIYIRFFDTSRNNLSEVRQCIVSAKSWREKITAILRAGRPVAA